MKVDFDEIKSPGDLIAFLLIIPFIALITPFLIWSYSISFFTDLSGWLDT